VPGAVSWLGLLWAHLHPALALVFIVPFMPHYRRIAPQTALDLPPEEHSPLSAFEHEWKVVVDFGLLFFGLANAGVQFAAVGTVTWLVFLSPLVGKTIGIFGFGLAAESLGYPLPAGMDRRDLLLTAMTAGIGLTVALFEAGAAFTDPPTQSAAKMGALAGALIVPMAQLLKLMLKSKAVPSAAT